MLSYALSSSVRASFMEDYEKGRFFSKLPAIFQPLLSFCLSSPSLDTFEKVAFIFIKFLWVGESSFLLLDLRRLGKELLASPFGTQTDPSSPQHAVGPSLHPAEVHLFPTFFSEGSLSARLFSRHSFSSLCFLFLLLSLQFAALTSPPHTVRRSVDFLSPYLSLTGSLSSEQAERLLGLLEALSPFPSPFLLLALLRPLLRPFRPSTWALFLRSMRYHLMGEGVREVLSVEGYVESLFPSSSFSQEDLPTSLASFVLRYTLFQATRSRVSTSLHSHKLLLCSSSDLIFFEALLREIQLRDAVRSPSFLFVHALMHECLRSTVLQDREALLSLQVPALE